MLQPPLAHERRFIGNHSRPSAATIHTTMMRHGLDEAGSSLGVDAGEVEEAFVDTGVCADDSGGAASLGWGCDVEAGALEPI
jgi:hypothetical protein